MVDGSNSHCGSKQGSSGDGTQLGSRGHHPRKIATPPPNAQVPKLRSGSFGVLTVSFFYLAITVKRGEKLLLRPTDSHPRSNVVAPFCRSSSEVQGNRGRRELGYKKSRHCIMPSRRTKKSGRSRAQAVLRSWKRKSLQSTRPNSTEPTHTRAPTGCHDHDSLTSP